VEALLGPYGFLHVSVALLLCCICSLTQVAPGMEHKMKFYGTVSCRARAKLRSVPN
jgi:hypothetical protein